MGPLSEHVILGCDLQAPGEARRVVRRLCQAAGLPEDATDTAVLLTSEVVTNAVTHGRSDARLCVEATPTVVRVEVDDDNSRLPSVLADDPDALDGRGVAVLDRCASSWGATPRAVGKTVWFEIAA